MSYNRNSRNYVLLPILLFIQCMYQCMTQVYLHWLGPRIVLRLFLFHIFSAKSSAAKDYLFFLILVDWWVVWRRYIVLHVSLFLSYKVSYKLMFNIRTTPLNIATESLIYSAPDKLPQVHGYRMSLVVRHHMWNIRLCQWMFKPFP